MASVLNVGLVRCVGPLLVLVGVAMVVARVIMCTVPDCYNYGDCGEDRDEGRGEAWSEYER